MHWKLLQDLAGKLNTNKGSLALIAWDITNLGRCLTSLRTTSWTTLTLKNFPCPLQEALPNLPDLNGDTKTTQRFFLLEKTQLKPRWSISKPQPHSEMELLGMHPSKQQAGKAEGKQLEMELQKDVAAKRTVWFQRWNTHVSYGRMFQSPLATDVINP